jgi:hypothetical protein
MSRHALLAAVSIVTLTACDADATKPSTPPADPVTTPATQQTWLCGREYHNQAWGYQRRGVVLDTLGHVWRYNIKSMPNALVNPWQPKDLTSMSEEELKLRYNGATTTDQVVLAAEIAANLPLIAEAAAAKPTEPKGVGADMGSNTLYCYTYDAGKRTYAQIMLDQKGDWESTNPSTAAKTLGAWLDKALGEVK